MKYSNAKLECLSKTWEELGVQDPYWAVSSHPDKRGRRWDPAEFMKTGESAVGHYHQLIINHIPTATEFSHVLDFGCGVGRLTQAWAKRARQATGVDISSSMLQVAQKNPATLQNVHFILNQSTDLHIFKDETFGLVFSLACLQHIPPQFAIGYIAEFARVCQRGGIVAFQMPSRTLRSNWPARFRKTFVNCLPFGLGRFYRRWRHGSSAVFEMYYTPRPEVETHAMLSGLKLIHCHPDIMAGSSAEDFFYIFQKI